MVTICTTSLTLTNSTFCPYSLCIRFGWNWEQSDYFPTQNWLSGFYKRDKLLQRSGRYMNHQFNITQFYVVNTVYLCVLCGSGNKRRLFPLTTLTECFFCNRDLILWCTMCTICTTSLNFNNSMFCPHTGVVFCMDMGTNCHYISIQH